MRIPLSTYRLQFNRYFTFEDALKVVDYLSSLGIDFLYASPIFRARRGSDHGYDVIDPNAMNPEIGTPASFDRLVEETRRRGMGWLQDIVPNHMSYTGENELMMDVLENGQSSQFVDFFDIQWNHPYESLKGRILAPFLGKFYGDSLEGGEIKLRYDERGLSVAYYELRFPLRAESYIKVFSTELSSLKRALGADNPDFIRFLGILYSLKNLPATDDGREFASHLRAIKTMLWTLYNGNTSIRSFIERNIETMNGRSGAPESYNQLEKLLSEQLFRLSFWKVAGEEINYRRFFNINELISLRVEDESVLDYTHRLIFALIAEGKITALRVDHIDGLFDPSRYLKRLRDRGGELYIAVEKILGHNEELPSSWPVQGTTGYDFLNYVNGIFCKTENEQRFDRIYHGFINYVVDYRSLVFDKKRLIIGKYMAGDVDALAHLMKNISSRDRYGSDITMYGLKRALVDVLALFPVYRTYINKETYREADKETIRGVIAQAKSINPGFVNELDFIESFLLLRFKEFFDQEQKEQWLYFVMRFQQFTGPLMAKGFEDTALYVYNRFISLNEVGGWPGKFGILPEEFNEFNLKRMQQWPYSVNATSTHDTKRGEDVRARLNVISELPEEWRRNVRAWHQLNKDKKRIINGNEMPSRNDEYFLYQTLVGSFPFFESEYPAFVQRIRAYIIKAVREAKIYTAWLKPDEEYENAFLSFIDRVLTPLENNLFLKEFVPFQKKIANYGIINSLSQVLLKITLPGVPDFYQGTELWDFSLVDPDNRLPVDFAKRIEFLRGIRRRENDDMSALISELIAKKEDGRIKLFLIYRALNAMKAHATLFQEGAFLPLQADGKAKDSVYSFARRLEASWAVILVPRFPAGLPGSNVFPAGEETWADASVILPDGAPSRWRDAVTGGQLEAVGAIRVGQALRHFPVSLLLSN